MKRQINAYYYQQELDAIKDEMAYAIQQAYPQYLLSRHPTPRMNMVLDRLYAWAKDYEEWYGKQK